MGFWRSAHLIRLKYFRMLAAHMHRRNFPTSRRKNSQCDSFRKRKFNDDLGTIHLSRQRYKRNEKEKISILAVPDEKKLFQPELQVEDTMKKCT